MKISVCVPMYNEVLKIADSARQISMTLENLRYYCGYDYEMIFVDDGSNDGTAATLRNVVSLECMRNVKIIAYRANKGKGRAMREAVMRAHGDVVICTDCDLAYGTEIFRSAIDGIIEGTDVILGSRNLLYDGYSGYSRPRRILSRAYVMFLRLFAGFKHTDSQCGFKAFRGNAARRVFSLCRTDGFAYDYEVVMIAEKMRCRISEMPVSVIGYTPAKLKMFRDGINMIGDVFKIKKRLKKMRFKSSKDRLPPEKSQNKAEH